MMFIVLASVCFAAVLGQDAAQYSGVPKPQPQYAPKPAKPQSTGYAAQVPGVWDALRVLRGGKDLTVEDQQQLIAYAVPGKDYPINAYIPEYGVDCAKFKQPGFYAETQSPSNCQIFHRCDLEGVATSFLCPNQTLFNQITLICDWFFNVDCSKSAQFVDYSNSRLGLYENVPLLDDQLEYTIQTSESTQSAYKPAAPAPAYKAPAPQAKPAPAPQYKPAPAPARRPAPGPQYNTGSA